MEIVLAVPSIVAVFAGLWTSLGNKDPKPKTKKWICLTRDGEGRVISVKTIEMPV